MKVLMSLGFVVVAAGMYFSVRYGLKPKATPLIKATEVKSLEEAGVLVYRRMRQDIRSKNLLVAGSSPLVSQYERFWQGFTLGANNDGARFSDVIAEGNVKLFKEAQLANTMVVDNFEELFKSLSGRVFEKRTLFYSSFFNSTHLVDMSFSDRFEKTQTPAVLITLTRFLVTKPQVAEQSLECPEEGDALHGHKDNLVNDLDCLAKRVSMQHYKKRLDPKKKYVALYRYGRQDYIAYFYDGQH